MQTTNTPNRPQLIRRSIVSLSLGLLLCVGVVGCSSKTSATKSGGTTTTAVPATTIAQAPATPAPTLGGSTGTANGGQNGGNTGTGGNTGGTSGTAGGSGTGSTTTATIVSFTTPENIDCHNGNSQMFTASWTTQNATKVTISIDGPGIYDTYGPNDSVSLPFSCGSSHTYLLTAFDADGHTVTKQITLQPRNVQSSTDTDMP